MDVQEITQEAFAALGTGRQVQPFSARRPDFRLEEAYRVTAAVRAERETRGERPVGRKIGFTNRTIWAEYNVHAPMWGYVYDRTVGDLPKGGRRPFFARSSRTAHRAGDRVWIGGGANPGHGRARAHRLHRLGRSWF